VRRETRNVKCKIKCNVGFLPPPFAKATEGRQMALRSLRRMGGGEKM